MGNPAGGSIFGASRLRGLYPPPGVPPTPTLDPYPTSPGIMPPPTGGIISDIVGGGTSVDPVTGMPISTGPTGKPGGDVPGGDVPTGDNTPPTGVTPGGGAYRNPTIRGRGLPTFTGREGPVSGIVRGGKGGAVSPVDLNRPVPRFGQTGRAPSTPAGPPTWAPNWGATIAPDRRQQVMPPGPVSEIIAAPPAPTPVAPTPVTPAPAPAKRKKREVETDPYERWKQLGRPGGSFDAWKAGQ